MSKHYNLAAKCNAHVPEHVKQAAQQAHAQGASPRAQIDAARQAAGLPVSYMPHVGAKQRAKALKRQLRQAGQEVQHAVATITKTEEEGLGASPSLVRNGAGTAGAVATKVQQP